MSRVCCISKMNSQCKSGISNDSFRLLKKLNRITKLFLTIYYFSAEIHVDIINDDEYEKSEEFYIELGEPIWEDPPVDEESTGPPPGGDDGRPVLSEISRCRVTITESKEFKVRSSTHCSYVGCLVEESRPKCFYPTALQVNSNSN
jgi:hypothetical protein